MKLNQSLSVALMCGALFGLQGAFAAAFANLDFESPRTPLVPDITDPYHRVPLAEAFPRWAGYLDLSPLSLAHANGSFLSSAGVSLWGPARVVNPDGIHPGGSIDGNYTAFLQSGHGLFEQEANIYSASLAQVGLVPNDAQFVQMKINASGPFTISLGGQPLNMVPLQVAPNYTLYAGDVSSFAGQTAELRITCEPLLGPTSWSYLWLDSISFVAVPEPNTMTLLAAGLATFGLAWGIRRRR